MTGTTTRSAFLAGARDSTPFVFIAGPFGLLFGVFATEAGLKLIETMVFTISVFAGAAQFTAVTLMQDQTPTLIILISALAVNLRVAMYSASLTPYLGGAPLWKRVFAAYLMVDQSYALSIVKFENEPDLSLDARLAYYLGTNCLIAPIWVAATCVGAVVGTQIPDSWAIDFALPITFIAMIAPMLRTPAHVAAALVGCVGSLLAAGIPYNLGLIVAGVAAMMTGAHVEVMLKRRGVEI
ncbi:MAG: AzlC family ABC transporter permease [Paracoccaceae bacterium]